MSTEIDLIQLRARVKELEDRLKFIYDHLHIEYSDTPEAKNKEIIDLIKKGNKLEAIKVYREIFNVGLAEAKDEVEKMEARYL
jgi:ribosomal protein L7/L12